MRGAARNVYAISLACGVVVEVPAAKRTALAGGLVHVRRLRAHPTEPLRRETLQSPTLSLRRGEPTRRQRAPLPGRPHRWQGPGVRSIARPRVGCSRRGARSGKTCPSKAFASARPRRTYLSVVATDRCPTASWISRIASPRIARHVIPVARRSCPVIGDEPRRPRRARGACIRPRAGASGARSRSWTSTNRGARTRARPTSSTRMRRSGTIGGSTIHVRDAEVFVLVSSPVHRCLERRSGRSHARDRSHRSGVRRARQRAGRGTPRARRGAGFAGDRAARHEQLELRRVDERCFPLGAAIGWTDAERGIVLAHSERVDLA